MSTVDFEQLLAAHQANLKQQYDDAEEYSDWMPDDGEYTVTIVKCAKGVSTKKDQNNPLFWWKLTGRIEAGDNAAAILGQEFSLGFYNTNAPGIMKGQAKALNGGDPVPFDDLDTVFKGAVGKVLQVKVATTKSAKNGQDYTNCYIQEVVQVEAVDSGLGCTPPQGEAGYVGPADQSSEQDLGDGEVLA
jgi:hypothetical protein